MGGTPIVCMHIRQTLCVCTYIKMHSKGQTWPTCPGTPMGPGLPVAGYNSVSLDTIMYACGRMWTYYPQNGEKVWIR